MRMVCMQSNYRRAGSTVAQILMKRVVLGVCLAAFAVVPSVQPSIAQDSDTPPELHSGDQGAPMYGRRPFRRAAADGQGGNAAPRMRFRRNGADDQPGPRNGQDDLPPFLRNGRDDMPPPMMRNGSADDAAPPTAPMRSRRGGPDSPDNGQPGGPPPGGRFDGSRPGFGGRSHEGGGLFGRQPLDFSSLNLSDEQKQKIQQIRAKNGTAARSLQKSLRGNRDQLRDLMFDPNTSDEQLRAKRKELRQAQDRLEEMQLNDFLSIRKVFTPEQRQRFANLKSERRLADGNSDGIRPRFQRDDGDSVRTGIDAPARRRAFVNEARNGAKRHEQSN